MKKIVLILAIFLLTINADARNFCLATYASDKITIDGKLDEWHAIPYAIRDASQITMNENKAWSGPNDASGKFYLLWDEKNLYIAVKIWDDRVVNDWPDLYVFRGDSVELYFDMKAPKDRSRADNNEGVNQIQLAAPMKENETRYKHTVGKDDFSGIKVVSNKWEKGYIVEASIPIEKLGEIKKYNSIGFDMGINDCDNLQRDLQMMWNGTDLNWRGSTNYGEVKLVGPIDKIDFAREIPYLVNFYVDKNHLKDSDELIVSGCVDSHIKGISLIGVISANSKVIDKFPINVEFDKDFGQFSINRRQDNKEIYTYTVSLEYTYNGNNGKFENEITVKKPVISLSKLRNDLNLMENKLKELKLMLSKSKKPELFMQAYDIEIRLDRIKLLLYTEYKDKDLSVLINDFLNECKIFLSKFSGEKMEEKNCLTDLLDIFGDDGIECVIDSPIYGDQTTGINTHYIGLYYCGVPLANIWQTNIKPNVKNKYTESADLVQDDKMFRIATPVLERKKLLIDWLSKKQRITSKEVDELRKKVGSDLSGIKDITKDIKQKLGKGNIYFGDMHLHTTYSDGSVLPETMVKVAIRNYLDFIAITDHDEIKGVVEAQERVKQMKLNYLIITGEEVTTPWAHILAINVDKAIPSTKQPVETFDMVHKAGGITIWAHPGFPESDWTTSSLKELPAGIDACEGVPPAYKEWYEKGVKIPLVSNSDSHGTTLLSERGIILADDYNKKEIINSILNNKCMAYSVMRYSDFSDLKAETQQGKMEMFLDELLVEGTILKQMFIDKLKHRFSNLLE